MRRTKDKDNCQTIKCLTFLESPAQAELNIDDDEELDEDVEVEEDKNDNEEDNEEAEEDDNKEDEDNCQTIKSLTFLESQA